MPFPMGVFNKRKTQYFLFSAEKVQKWCFWNDTDNTIVYTNHASKNTLTYCKRKGAKKNDARLNEAKLAQFVWLDVSF